MIVYQKF
ncbi:hypothetical protein CP8484711_1321A, partial [Chlamydia psittaci 84-8471/1]